VTASGMNARGMEGMTGSDSNENSASLQSDNIYSEEARGVEASPHHDSSSAAHGNEGKPVAPPITGGTIHGSKARSTPSSQSAHSAA